MPPIRRVGRNDAIVSGVAVKVYEIDLTAGKDCSLRVGGRNPTKRAWTPRTRGAAHYWHERKCRNAVKAAVARKLARGYADAVGETDQYFELRKARWDWEWQMILDQRRWEEQEAALDQTLENARRLEEERREEHSRRPELTAFTNQGRSKGANAQTSAPGPPKIKPRKDVKARKKAEEKMILKGGSYANPAGQVSARVRAPIAEPPLGLSPKEQVAWRRAQLKE